ncbi:hypothetical protein G7054_g1271 [Neopestalotiopsis clavispora]|nr:hypothetical protein G7054_g1271 [Neopestalotiopsis clavispora]
MSANTNGRPLWSAEDRLDVVLAALFDANKLVGINWDNVAAILATRFPDKTPRAFRAQFEKAKAQFMKDINPEGKDQTVDPESKDKTTKGPRKRGAASVATASFDAVGDHAPAKRRRFRRVDGILHDQDEFEGVGEFAKND